MTLDTHVYLLIGFTLALALVLRLLALPQPLLQLNPDWVLLVVIYWCLTFPERFGIGSAWLTGLWVDAATGPLLGQHALIYALAAYCCVRFHTRLRVFPLSQQLPLILLFLLSAQLLLFCLEALRGRPLLSWSYWLPCVTGTLAWPLVLTGCGFLKRRHLPTL